MSPQQTPTGSPSKHHQPPGAFDLPHVFENAMRLLPTMGSPSKSKPGTPTSPNKLKPQKADESDYSSPDLTTLGPGSPTRKSNKENTPPSARPGIQKEPSYLTHAAQSRQEPYRNKDAEQSTRYLQGPQRLSPEELEKARKPAVKRLANVTQLCRFFASARALPCLCRLQISSTTTSTSSLMSTPARIAYHNLRPKILRLPRHRRQSTMMPLHSISVVSAPICASDGRA